MPTEPPTHFDLPVLYWTPIDERHTPTGRCRHFNLSAGREDPSTTLLAIVGDAKNGFYLYHFQGDWDFITDTWHETLDDALAQAEFEYTGVSKTWHER